MFGLSAAAAAATSVANWWSGDSGVEQDDHDLHEHDTDRILIESCGHKYWKDEYGYITLKELKELIIAWWGSEPSDGEEEYRLDDYDRS